MTDLRGLVLAAGLGTRLRPVTDYLPKPLLPLDGVTLLDRAADALFAAGCDRVAVNAHHRADRIAEHLRDRFDRERFHLSLEPTILGTGGALHGAREFLSDADDFLVFNGDVMSDLPLAALVAEHHRHGALATLGLVDRPDINTVLVAADGTVRDVAGRLQRSARRTDRELTFTGIACYSRAFLDHVPRGSSNLVEVLATVIAGGAGCVRAFGYHGVWDDLGTLPRYLDAHRRRLGPGFVSVASGVVVPKTTDLDECVALPGATVPAGVSLHRAVIGSGWMVSLSGEDDPIRRLATTAGFAPGLPLEWITGHGSDRRFARLRDGSRSAVVMVSPPHDLEHDRSLAILSFLYDRGLGAPAILAHDPISLTVLMEDLGEDTLESLVQADPARAADLYDRVLDRLADLQTFGAESRHHCRLAWDRTFDRAHLRWETQYFQQRFLADLMGVPAARLAPLEQEFADLATACLQQLQTLVHRDFQSQNIILKDGMVRLVDVQGMRWGPVAYDVASLALDPYVMLPAALRQELLDSFPERVARRGGPRIGADDWRAMVRAAGLQRVMQVLGAYAFLGVVKNRRAFLKHVPQARQRLEALLYEEDIRPATRFDPPPMPRLTAVIHDLTPGLPLANATGS